MVHIPNMDSSPPERNTNTDDFDFTEKAESSQESQEYSEKAKSSQESGKYSEFEKAELSQESQENSEFEKTESQESPEYSDISVIDPQSSSGSNNQSDFEDLEMSNVGEGDDTSNNTFYSTVNTTLISQQSPSSSPIGKTHALKK